MRISGSEFQSLFEGAGGVLTPITKLRIIPESGGLMTVMLLESSIETYVALRETIQGEESVRVTVATIDEVAAINQLRKWAK